MYLHDRIVAVVYLLYDVSTYIYIVISKHVHHLCGCAHAHSTPIKRESLGIVAVLEGLGNGAHLSRKVLPVC